MKKKILCLLLAVLMSFTGMETAAAQTKGQIKTTALEYLTLPVSRVRALVDRNGYQPDREKKVIFLGENLTGSFRVIREADREIVYTGTIQKAAGAGDSHRESISVGDFSAVTEPGAYYIEQSEVGRSYSFIIDKNTYEPVFTGFVQNAWKSLPPSQQVSAEDICDVSFGMNAMLLALQCHGILFETEHNLVMPLLEMAEWLMSFQEESTGSMFGDYEATAAFCGILAQSADVFGKYDAKVAKKYRAASAKAWKWLESQPQKAREYPSAEFYAAAQLLRAEGNRARAGMAEKYLKQYFKERKTEMTEDRFAFYGAATYLGTVKNADRKLCAAIMQEFVDETGEISRMQKKQPYLVYSEDIAQNLHKVLLISFVDYITPSNEYAVIIENTIHYLCGRNETGERFLEETGSWVTSEKTAGRTLEWDGILLFGLSNLLEQEVEE